MEKKDFYEGEYMPQMHKIGKLTGLLGAVLSSCRHLYWQLCTDFFQNLLHLPPHLFLQQVHLDFSGL